MVLNSRRHSAYALAVSRSLLSILTALAVAAVGPAIRLAHCPMADVEDGEEIPCEHCRKHAGEVSFVDASCCQIHPQAQHQPGEALTRQTPVVKNRTGAFIVVSVPALYALASPLPTTWFAARPSPPPIQVNRPLIR